MILLKELKEKDSRICACMVARHGLEGLMMFPESFKEDVADIWEPLSKNIDDMLSLVAKYGQIGLKKSYTELLGYGVYFGVVSMSDTALIVIVKGDNPLEYAKDIVGLQDETNKKIYTLFGITD